MTDLAKSRRKRLPVCQLLGKMRGVDRLSDTNLKDLHDLTLIVFVECQEELHRRGRGAESGVQIVSMRQPFCDERRGAPC